MTSTHRLVVASVSPVVRSDSGRARVAEQIVSLTAPSSYAADQYRALRHVVERLRAESGLQVVAVTSPAPGDGKTMTALNLAGALAQSAEARVLIMDADLRRSSVSEYLGLSRRLPGLADALADPRYDLANVAHRLEAFNVSVVPAGKSNVMPYELLSSPRLEMLLTDARRLFDSIVIDTPPFVLLPDSRLLERWVDGFMVVVAAHKTPRRQLAETFKALDPAKIASVIFNADDRSESAYYGYYGYYGTGPDAPRVPWWRRLLGAR